MLFSWKISLKLSANYFWSNKHHIGYRWLEICYAVNNGIAFVTNKLTLTICCDHMLQSIPQTNNIAEKMEHTNFSVTYNREHHFGLCYLMLYLHGKVMEIQRGGGLCTLAALWGLMQHSLNYALWHTGGKQLQWFPGPHSILGRDCFGGPHAPCHKVEERYFPLPPKTLHQKSYALPSFFLLNKVYGFISCECLGEFQLKEVKWSHLQHRKLTKTGCENLTTLEHASE